MEEELENFPPLLTQANPAPGGADSPAADPPGLEKLPRGLAVLVRAGVSLERTLLISLLLIAISLVLGAALALFPGREKSVVWDESQSGPRVLVEVP